MRFALVKAAKPVSAQRLHNAHINVRVVMPQERLAVKFYVMTKRVEIMIEQVLAHVRRQISLGVKQQRRNVILQRAFAPALVINEKRFAVTQQDVARLKIAIEKIIAWSAQQKVGQAAEIVFQRLLVKGNACEPQKIIFEVIQVPRDRLAIEAADRIAHLIIQIAARFHLKTRQDRDDFAISLHDGRGDVLALAIFRQKLKQGRVPEVFFEIRALAQILTVNFRHRQPAPAKMLGEFQKRNVLFAHSVQNADRALIFAAQPDDLAARAAKLSLQRLNALHRRAKMLLKKSVENVHESNFL